MSIDIAAAILTPQLREDRDHLRGRITAPVSLVEYGDFECPFCGRAHVVAESIRETLGDQVCFAFRHFPLTRMHPHAETAAEAAEAAGAQGKFWEMHDMLYENQDRLGDQDLVRYAHAIGLETERFVRELAAGIYASRVREDFMSGVRSGVNGTPTFFINGIRWDGPWDGPHLLAAISAAAADADEAA